jgi:periplasmic copper chaperone A
MRRHAAMAAIVVVVLAVAAPPAGAHVTLEPAEARQGRFEYLRVRVPNEADDLDTVRDGASTTQLELSLPADEPLRVVQVQPTPGWEYRLETTELDEPIEREGDEPVTEVVSKITWSGGAIAPTEFATFEIVLGPLPEDVDMLMFPAVQVYDSGEEVAWTEADHDAEFPAPSLRLVPPDEHAAAMGSGGEVPSAGPTIEDAATQDDVDGASVLGIVGIVAGLLGIALAVFALRRARRTFAPADGETRRSAGLGLADDGEQLGAGPGHA